jgi:hypothetical protein
MDGPAVLSCSKGKSVLILKPAKLNATNPDLVRPTTSFANDNDGFVQPNKRKLANSHVIQPKRYVLDTNQLCKQNQYQALIDHSYSGSTPKVSDFDMDNEEEISVKKPGKLPPIFIYDVNNHQEIIKDITSNVSGEFSTQLRGQSFKINVSTIDDYRKLTKFYDESNIKYHTFQNLQDKKLEVVIRNIPTSLSENELKTELSDLNYPVLKVTRLLNKDKMPYPLCVVELENNEEGKEIFNLEKLCYAIVRVEPKRKSNNIPQCTRCQRYNHTKNFCKLDPRCVRCLGQHHYSDCPKPKSETPQCVNCGESHTANFRGCKLHQELKSKSAKKALGKPNNKSYITTNETEAANPVQSPSTLNETDFPQTLGSVTKSFANAVKRSFSSQPSPDSSTQQESSSNDSSTMSNLEKVILDLVKSFMPMIKRIITNVMSSFLDGSV